VRLPGSAHPDAKCDAVLAAVIGGGRLSDGRVLFLYETAASFVDTDLAILESRYDVTPKECSRGSNLTEITRPVLRTDASYSWFALGHAARAVLAAKILGRPSVIVSGGWDVISMPEIAYGAARSVRGRLRARFALRGGTRVLAFSEWSRAAIRGLSGREADLLYLGVDVDRYRPAGTKEDLVITAGTLSRENLARKGLETFVRAAAHLPSVRFVLVGKSVDDSAEFLRRIATPNVEFAGWLGQEPLLRLLQCAGAYVQVSYNEGFGLALAEGMACECVPVVTREGALPEVAGDVGMYVPYGNVPATADAIREALGSRRGADARRRIQGNFPLARRREGVLALMRSLLGG